jgi:hypothetical protein
VCFDALRESRGELRGKTVILLGVERHIYERASRVAWKLTVLQLYWCLSYIPLP